MANIVTNTENLSHGEWSPFDGMVVTPNAVAPPAFAGPHATRADLLTDTGGAEASLYGTYRPISVGPFTTSLYLKDAGVTDYSFIGMQCTGGTGIFNGIWVDVTDGTVSGPAGSIVSSATQSVGDGWFRISFLVINVDDTHVRPFVYPAYSATSGAAGNGTLTGAIYAWGSNITDTPILMPYVPDPFYSTSPLVLIKKA